jgi:hypothetical protein
MNYTYTYRTKQFNMTEVARAVVHFRCTSSISTVTGFASYLETICPHTRIVHTAVDGQPILISLQLRNTSPYFFIVAKLYFLRDGPFLLLVEKLKEIGNGNSLTFSCTEIQLTITSGENIPNWTLSTARMRHFECVKFKLGLAIAKQARSKRF